MEFQTLWVKTLQTTDCISMYIYMLYESYICIYVIYINMVFISDCCAFNSIGFSPH